MKKIIKYIDKPLFLVTVILFIIGLIMVFSASNVTAYMTYAVSPYNYFFKQGAFLLAGLVSWLGVRIGLMLSVSIYLIVLGAIGIVISNK